MDSSEPDQNQIQDQTRNNVHSSGLNTESNVSPESPLPINLDPRGYQLEVFEVARSRNTIAVLETGSGKTLIAVMLIEYIGKAVKASGKKRLIIFLAPTVHLVNQQYKIVKDLTNFEVEEYFGAKGVDSWDLKSWEKEINDHDVLVMTPQILLDALRKAFLNIEMACLIIIDECHRATGNHPYAKIMDFYHRANDKPKIFGMTASPVIKKGVSSAKDCEGQISELECILDSRVYTVGDRAEIDACISSAKQRCRFYDPPQLPALSLKPKIEALWSESDALLSELQNSMQSDYRDVNDKFKALRKRMSNEVAKTLYCLEDLGLFCAYEAVKICLENFPDIEEESEIYRKGSLQCKFFLEEVMQSIRKSLPYADSNLLEGQFDFLEAVSLGYISPKLHELIQLFQSFRESSLVMCIIFVERIITARAVERFVKKVCCLSHLAVSYLTGTNTSVDALSLKRQKETLDSFRSGKVNLLFTTDVVEEGIHVPNCSYVIRFDLPKTVRSYVQSRGRARQVNSEFVVMLERGNLSQRNQLFDIVSSERSMTNTASNRDTGASSSRTFTAEEKNTYSVCSTGASVTSDSSVNLIQHYCEKLSRNKSSNSKPIYKYQRVGDHVKCILTLPSDASLQTIVGPLSRNDRSAKQLVCFEACKRLHKIGALDDHLLPVIEEPSELDHIVKSKEPISGAGTTKRKELHGTVSICVLCGTWGDKPDGANFYSYKFDFTCDIASEIFSGFVLLLDSELVDDVGNIELDLYLISKIVRTSVSSCGQVHLDALQITKAKCFHELIFNSLYGRLTTWSRAGGERKFLLQNDTKSLWSPSNLYLLLPIKKSNDILEGSWKINWEGINSCVSAIEFFRQKSLLGAVHHDDDRRNSPTSDFSSVDAECKGTHMLHFANSVVNVNDVKNKVVLAIHTGRMYCIFEVSNNLSAESPFDGTNEKLAALEQITFADYYKKRYGITLRHPGQPMLRLKQSHNPHNLLVNFNEEDEQEKSSQAGPVIRKPQVHVHIPPELLYILDIGRDVLKSLYLLPSLMHRLESLMLASQLREVIDGQNNNFSVPSSLILEALTTVRCCEKFSMERLELLGDSVLKYAVSCHLFLKYPKKHEGRLSSTRSWAVCNSTLHKAGTDRKLQGYIRDAAFEPRRWVAPGQRSIHVVHCECGVETQEVPLDAKFQTEDPKVIVGKFCDRGHRWICSKNISDCVEALIGAYYVGSGLTASLHIMKWLGIDAELEPAMVNEAITAASLHTCVPKANEIASLERKIGYEFSVKGLLQEAITHLSEQELGLGYSYERLEFLGDAVLDLLITWHLYQSYTDIDPGELTDLRSASVNNENFAQAAVRQNLQQHILHSSGLLLSQITEYVKIISEMNSDTRSLPSIKGPKALGDIVESIAGAILIDTKLNLDVVWRIFKPLLSPLVTPDKLELPPLRELTELCDSLGYFIKEKCIKKGDKVHAVLSLQLQDDLLVQEGQGPNRKTAKGDAAFLLLRDLEKRGISKSRCGSKRKGDHPDYLCEAPSQDEHSLEPVKHKRAKVEPANMPTATSVSNILLPLEDSDSNFNVPVITSINMKKGGPRSTLYELCKKLQWPMPAFDTTEHRQRTAFEFGEGTERRTGYICFTSRINLCIPNDGGNVECKGNSRADKKSSLDSAALEVLYELQRLGKLKIASKE